MGAVIHTNTQRDYTHRYIHTCIRTNISEGQDFQTPLSQRNKLSPHMQAWATVEIGSATCIALGDFSSFSHFELL